MYRVGEVSQLYRLWNCYTLGLQDTLKLDSFISNMMHYLTGGTRGGAMIDADSNARLIEAF